MRDTLLAGESNPTLVAHASPSHLITRWGNLSEGPLEFHLYSGGERLMSQSIFSIFALIVSLLVVQSYQGISPLEQDIIYHVIFLETLGPILAIRLYVLPDP